VLLAVLIARGAREPARLKLQRLAYAVLGFVFAGLGIWVVVTQRAAWWPLIVFAIAPDVTLLFGFRAGLQRGQLDPRAVPAYNAVHRYWAPGALVLVAFFLHADPWVAAGSHGVHTSRSTGASASDFVRPRDFSADRSP